MEIRIHSSKLNQTSFQALMNQDREVLCLELLEAASLNILKAFSEIIELSKAEANDKYISLVERIVNNNLHYNVRLSDDHAELLDDKMLKAAPEQVIALYYKVITGELEPSAGSMSAYRFAFLQSAAEVTSTASVIARLEEFFKNEL